jgi:hypothetical protein
MADVLTTKTQVDPTVEEIVSAQVQEVLTASMVIPGSIMDMSAQVGPGMDKLKIPKFGNFTVSSKVAGTAVDAQINAFTTDDLDLDKHQVVQFLVEKQASVQAKVAVEQAYIEQAARDLAAKMDADLYTILAAGPSAAAPDHIVQFANSPTNTLGKADFLAARKLLSKANVPLEMRACLVSPLQESEILAISEFVRVDESGGSAALRNGQIGKLFGFDVYVSSQATDGVAMFYHKNCQAFARQWAPEVATESSLANLGVRWSIDHMWGSKHLYSGKLAVKVNASGA